MNSASDSEKSPQRLDAQRLRPLFVVSSGFVIVPDVLNTFIRTLLLSALLWFVMGQGIALHAQEAESISLADYRAVLAEVASQLAAADPADPVAAEAQYAQARAELSRVTGVELPSGEVVAVQPLLPPLPIAAAGANDAEANDADAVDVLDEVPDIAEMLQTGLARIELVQNQLDATVRDNSAARLTMLEDVLARPEFSEQRTWWQRARTWVFDRLADWLPEVDGAGLGSFWGIIGVLLIWLIVIGGGLIIALLISYWMQGLLGRFVRDSKIRRRGAIDSDMPLTADAARQQATSLAQAGNYRMAVRQLYLAALLTLEETGVIRHDRSLTNREVLAQIQASTMQSAASSPASMTSDSTGADDTAETIRSHLLPVIDTFDAVWYGVREPDRATFDRYAREIDSLSESLHRRRTSARDRTESRRTVSREE